MRRRSSDLSRVGGRTRDCERNSAPFKRKACAILSSGNYYSLRASSNVELIYTIIDSVVKCEWCVQLLNILVKVRGRKRT